MSGVDELFEQLRREYLTEAPARLAELRKDLAALRAGEPDASRSLAMRFHRLAGSGGSYGFPDISVISAEAERWLKQPPSPAEGLDRVTEWVARLASAFDAAADELGLPAGTPSRRLAFGWRAIVVGDPSDPLTARVTRSLEDARYSVSHCQPDAEPRAIPVSERPDLAVLAFASPAERSEVVARWASPGPARPASVLLVGALTPADSLAHPWCELDDVVAPDRVETELSSQAGAIGWSADTPPTVLVLEPDPTQARSIRSAIERAGGRASLVATGGELCARLEHETPDLILTEWSPPDASGPALLRAIRRLAAHRARPVVVLTRHVGDEERVAAIRAGADDVLAHSTPPARTAVMLLARAEWSRRRRARAQRDELTGLLSHASMIEELAGAAAFARRAAEPFGLVLLDVDHFRRVNDRFGHGVGDRLLAEIAAAIRALVRSSDSIARLGGDEIGILIRRSSPEDCAALAEKLRLAVSRAAVTLGESEVRVKASAGVACVPEHASTGPELLTAAARALAEAKARGRDRTVVRDR